MNFKPKNFYLSCEFKEEKPTINKLQTEIKEIKNSISDIEKMNLSEKTKKLCIYELNLEIRELKNKMHDLIEEM